LGFRSEVKGRGEHRIETDAESVFNHAGNDFSEEGTGKFETGVGVALNEPYIVGFVDHEVEAKDFEVVLAFERIHEFS
jgi:hypothetical protein